MIHTQAARRWNIERRQRRIRHLYYHALDYAGFICWAMVGIIATAMGLFVVFHR